MPNENPHYKNVISDRHLLILGERKKPVTKKKPSKSKKKRIARRKRLNKLKIKPEASSSSSSSTVKNLHEDSDSEVEYWNKHADCIALQLDMTDDFDNPIEEEEKVPKEGAEFEAYVKNRLELSYARMLERNDYLFSPTSPERLYQWLKGFYPLTEQ